MGLHAGKKNSNSPMETDHVRRRAGPEIARASIPPVAYHMPKFDSRDRTCTRPAVDAGAVEGLSTG